MKEQPVTSLSMKQSRLVFCDADDKERQTAYNKPQTATVVCSDVEDKERWNSLWSITTSLKQPRQPFCDADDKTGQWHSIELASKSTTVQAGMV